MRVPQVPSEPLAELDEFLEPFRVRFRRRESQEAVERYLTGLLSEHPNKNCDTLGELVPGASEQQLQGLLAHMVWESRRSTSNGSRACALCTPKAMAPSS